MGDALLTIMRLFQKMITYLITCLKKTKIDFIHKVTTDKLKLWQCDCCVCRLLQYKVVMTQLLSPPSVFIILKHS